MIWLPILIIFCSLLQVGRFLYRWRCKTAINPILLIWFSISFADIIIFYSRIVEALVSGLSSCCFHVIKWLVSHLKGVK